MDFNNIKRLFVTLVCVAPLAQVAHAVTYNCASSCSQSDLLCKKTQAVCETINNDRYLWSTEECSYSKVPAFYWEIGDVNGVLAADAIGSGSNTSGTTPLEIASASKWIFGTYTLEKLKQQGLLRTDSVKTRFPSYYAALTLQSGYHYFDQPACSSTDTVQSCFDALYWGQKNSTHDTVPVDGYTHFWYDGGHFQHLAADIMGLGSYTDSTLASAYSSVIPGPAFGFTVPVPAGGMQMSAQEYGKFLRKILSKDANGNYVYEMGARLGQEAVCTQYDASTCPGAGNTSDANPSATDTHYALAHWVEDETMAVGGNYTGPVIGDRAYSSAGAYGFYPWIDSNKQYYGLVSRRATTGLTTAFKDSVLCGQKLRKAWATGGAQ